MTTLLEVLIGSNVKDYLVVMVDNQSILREINRWVGEGSRSFLVLSVTIDFLSREGEGREVIGERLRDKTVPWQVQHSLMQTVTNSFPCGLRGIRDYTLCQRTRK